MNTNNNIYTITKKEYGIITFEKNELTLNEAYQIATPEYTIAIYPNNNWHVMLKWAVIQYFNNNNNKLTVSYETKDKNSDIKIKEFIISI